MHASRPSKDERDWQIFLYPVGCVLSRHIRVSESFQSDRDPSEGTAVAVHDWVDPREIGFALPVLTLISNWQRTADVGPVPVYAHPPIRKTTKQRCELAEGFEAVQRQVHSDTRGLAPGTSSVLFQITVCYLDCPTPEQTVLPSPSASSRRTVGKAAFDKCLAAA